MSDIQQLASELALIEARRVQIRRELLRHWDTVGSFESSGYYVAKIQSLTPEVPVPLHVARIIPTLINADQQAEYFLHFLNRLSLRALPGAIKSLPIAAELFAVLSEADADGGVMEVVGKPRKVIVRYEPATGKREGLQHVLEPGDVPLAVTTVAVSEEGEEEEGAEYGQQLSPGD